MSVTVDNIFADFSRQAAQFAQRLLQNPQANARLASGVMVVLILLISWSAARLTWQIVYQPQIQPPPAPRLSASSPAAVQSAPKLAKVSGLHLFGKAGKTDTAPPPPTDKPVDAPETRLSLTLQGVLASDKMGNSLAIIAEKGKPAKVYAPGDKLPGGATVHQIYADRVILSRAGQLETLPLKIKKADIGKQARNRKTRPARRTPGTIQQASGGQRVQKIRQQLRSNPQELWKNIRITPVMGKDGSIEGYYFRHNDRKAMQELGLQPQDIITAVNGQPVTDMNAMMNLMKDIQNAPQLSLDIRRNGVDQTIMINLN